MREYYCVKCTLHRQTETKKKDGVDINASIPQPQLNNAFKSNMNQPADQVVRKIIAGREEKQPNKNLTQKK